MPISRPCAFYFILFYILFCGCLLFNYSSTERESSEVVDRPDLPRLSFLSLSLSLSLRGRRSSKEEEEEEEDKKIRPNVKGKKKSRNANNAVKRRRERNGLLTAGHGTAGACAARPARPTANANQQTTKKSQTSCIGQVCARPAGQPASQSRVREKRERERRRTIILFCSAEYPPVTSVTKRNGIWSKQAK